jgi:hypothetical protein
MSICGPSVRYATTYLVVVQLWTMTTVVSGSRKTSQASVHVQVL